jgi:hypothetical protein
VGSRTDARGRYCIVWAKETITPSAVVGDGGPIGLRRWRPLRGAAAPPGCQETAAGIPWDRAENLRSSWQFLTLLLLPALALSALAAAAGFRKRRGGCPLLAAGVVLAGAGLVAQFVLWSA